MATQKIRLNQMAQYYQQHLTDKYLMGTDQSSTYKRETPNLKNTFHNLS